MRERLLHAPELLDVETHDAAVLEQSLAHVAQVNRFLGGYTAIRRGLQRAGPGWSRVLDVGTASADIPRLIARDARRSGRRIEIVATDVHPEMRRIASLRTADDMEIRVEAADALALPYPDRSFDVVILAMTLHHFEDDAPVRALREAARVGRMIIVSDLERCMPNYIGARLLGETWWRGNPLTRHDGPLSVQRAFTANELHDLARAAGLVDVVVERRFFFRLLMTARSR